MDDAKEVPQEVSQHEMVEEGKKEAENEIDG